jgi:hypothetical protein
MAGSGCGRFYVLTGPEYGDNVSSQIVEVDLIMTGKLAPYGTFHGYGFDSR